jgi:hypothetical protein
MLCEDFVRIVLAGGIGIEPAEDIRGGRFLEFNGRDEAQDVVPEYRV